MSTTRIALFTSLFFLAGISTARADMPPPDGYVEQCTVAKKQQPGTTCEMCPNSYESFNGDDPCKMKYAGTNFEYVCKGWGASVWEEVWCDGAPRPAEPEAEPDSGCSYTNSSLGKSAQVTLPVGLGLIALLFARKRRRRERSSPRNGS